MCNSHHMLAAVVFGLRAFCRRGRRATFGIWVGRGVWGGRGVNYVCNRRIPCNLHCFLVAQILAKKPRLRRPLETMRVLQCFLGQEGRMYWHSQYFVDVGYEPFF